MKRVIFTTLIVFVLFSCKKEKNNIDFGYDYFPMEEGRYVEYDVLRVWHDEDLNPKHDTIQYRLRTVIGEEVIDNSGRLARKFFQYRYDKNTGAEIDQRVWTRVIDGKRGEVVEENQRMIRMIFPVKKNEEWNVNAFNTLEKLKVYYLDHNQSRLVNGHQFENTAKIVYDDFLSLVDYRKKHEVYAKGIGLVERSFKDFTINNFDTLTIKKGEETHYKLTSYGKQ